MYFIIKQMPGPVLPDYNYFNLLYIYFDSFVLCNSFTTTL